MLNVAFADRGNVARMGARSRPVRERHALPREGALQGAHSKRRALCHGRAQGTVVFLLCSIMTSDMKLQLQEQEKRRRIEEAVVHRKRSSRIAVKESEKEEQRMAAKKRAEEEEKMARAKRQETRLKKEEAERAKRERARDQRRKERDDREARMKAKAERAERYVLMRFYGNSIFINL